MDKAEYINIYHVDRAYGGDEEGGWWYDSYEPVVSLKVERFDGKESTIEAVAGALESTFTYQRNRDSVGYAYMAQDYEVRIEEHPGRPSAAPQYE